VKTGQDDSKFGFGLSAGDAAGCRPGKRTVRRARGAAHRQPGVRRQVVPCAIEVLAVRAPSASGSSSALVWRRVRRGRGQRRCRNGPTCSTAAEQHGVPCRSPSRPGQPRSHARWARSRDCPACLPRGGRGMSDSRPCSTAAATGVPARETTLVVRGVSAASSASCESRMCWCTAQESPRHRRRGHPVHPVTGAWALDGVEPNRSASGGALREGQGREVVAP
jgi:hypothetical protein